MNRRQGRLTLCHHHRSAWRGAGAALALTFALLSGSAPTAVLALPAHFSGQASHNGQRHLVAVFGADDRTDLPPELKPVQQKMGLLFNSRSRTVCTAFCVAPDVVATAGHCLHRTLGERPPTHADFWFARNYDAVRDYARIAGYANGAASQNIMSGSISLNVRPPIDATRDWALVRLSRPICSKGVLPVRVLTLEQVLEYAQANKVFQISYHRDYTPWRLAYSRPCSVSKSFETADWSTIAQDFNEPAQLLLHTCDTGGASSGSPLLLDTPRGPEVIGINVGTYVQSKVLMQDGKVAQRLKADTVANTGVSAGAFAERLELFKHAQILNTHDEVRELQTALKERKFYLGPIDGTYRAGLRQAIEAFEAANDLPLTGLATRALLKRVAPAGAERKIARPQKS
jgi:Putative peptidoglycan binding domain/Trypsin-like peptidase domain